MLRYNFLWWQKHRERFFCLIYNTSLQGSPDKGQKIEKWKQDRGQDRQDTCCKGESEDNSPTYKRIFLYLTVSRYSLWITSHGYWYRVQGSHQQDTQAPASRLKIKIKIINWTIHLCWGGGSIRKNFIFVGSYPCFCSDLESTPVQFFFFSFFFVNYVK